MVELFNKEKKEEHPSYGIAKFSRVTGGERNFYGTVIKPNHYIQFELFTSEKEVSNLNGQEHFYKKDWKPIVSIKMTAAQFADLVSTMNIGDGVPVTIEEIQGKSIETCPKQVSPLDLVKESAEDGIEKTIKGINEEINFIISSLKEGKLGKKNIDEMLKKLDLISNRMESNADFHKKEIIEVGEKVTSQVKAEIENTTNAIVHKLGLNSIEKFKELELKTFKEKKDE